MVACSVINALVYNTEKMFPARCHRCSGGARPPKDFTRLLILNNVIPACLDHIKREQRLHIRDVPVGPPGIEGCVTPALTPMALWDYCICSFLFCNFCHCPEHWIDSTVIILLLQVWSGVKQANSGRSVCEIGSVIGRMWRELQDADKQPYFQSFTDAKVYRARHGLLFVHVLFVTCMHDRQKLFTF